jgi:hypothetical protein
MCDKDNNLLFALSMLKLGINHLWFLFHLQILIFYVDALVC